MILFLTNAPSEILALRSIVVGLPSGFPALRAANPAHLDHALDFCADRLPLGALEGVGAKSDRRNAFAAHRNGLRDQGPVGLLR